MFRFLAGVVVGFMFRRSVLNQIEKSLPTSTRLRIVEAINTVAYTLNGYSDKMSKEINQ
jgi:hypothetical protein